MKEAKNVKKSNIHFECLFFNILHDIYIVMVKNIFLSIVVEASSLVDCVGFCRGKPPDEHFFKLNSFCQFQDKHNRF